MVLVKKYGNRRLYDTVASRYITLEELAAIIRGGEEAKVVDAKTGEDLTTSTMAQIIVEGRGAAKLLPAPLLVQLIRMGDGALAEFLGQYVSWALEAYLQARQGMQAMTPFNPFMSGPFGSGTLSRMFGMGAKPSPAEPQPPAASSGDDVQALRRELDELKKSMKKKR